jgi:CBS domain-containing protein
MVLTVGPGHTLREAARMMSERNVGAAVVIDPELPGPGIVTERDVLQSIAAGQDPDVERVEEHQTTHLVFAGPDWSLERAASEMSHGGFRHLIVIEAGDVVGLLSMRDIVRVWSSDGATSSMPAEAASG